MSQKNSADFEEQIARLQEIARLLEQGGLSLEKSLELYKEGVGLAADCRKLLDNARHLVRVYTEDGLKDFAESGVSAAGGVNSAEDDNDF